jgi:hypothetical protein
MAYMINIIESSNTIHFFTWLLSPIWDNPVGRTALLSVVAYLVGYSIYNGYLSSFTGGFGSLSFSRLGIELSDLITLLPASLITVIKVFPNGIKQLLGLSFRIFLYFLLPFIIGIIVGAILRFEQISLGNWALQSGFLIYNIALFTSFYLFWKRNRTWLLILDLVQLAGVILLSLGISLATTSQNQLSNQVQLTQHIQLYSVFQTIYIFLQEVSICSWLLLIVFLIPMAFGAEVGKIAIKEKILSQITSLVLKLPISLLKEYEQLEPIDLGRTSIWGRLWFTTKLLPAKATLAVHNYIFTEGVSFFLVETFKNTIACYLTDMNSKPGKLIIIDREAVLAIVLEPPSHKK